MSSGGRYQRVITYSVIGSVFSSSPPTPDAIRASPKSHTFRSQFLFTGRLLRVAKFVQLTRVSRVGGAESPLCLCAAGVWGREHGGRRLRRTLA